MRTDEPFPRSLLFRAGPAAAHRTSPLGKLHLGRGERGGGSGMSEETSGRDEKTRAFHDHQILMLAWERMHPAYTYREYVEAMLRIAQEVGI